MAKPQKSFSLGQAHASVFVSKSKKGAFYTVSAQRRFKNEKNKWQSSNSYTASQLANAIAVMQRALDYILDQEPVQTEKE
jgi:hypothetical protein